MYSRKKGEKRKNKKNCEEEGDEEVKVEINYSKRGEQLQFFWIKLKILKEFVHIL